MVIGPRAESLIKTSGYVVTSATGYTATVRAPEGESAEDAEGFAEGMRAIGYKASSLSFKLEGKTIRQVTFWLPEALRKSKPLGAGAYGRDGGGASLLGAPPRGEPDRLVVEDNSKPLVVTSPGERARCEPPAATSDNPLECSVCGANLGLVARQRADGEWQCGCGAEFTP